MKTKNENPDELSGKEINELKERRKALSKEAGELKEQEDNKDAIKEKQKRMRKELDKIQEGVSAFDVEPYIGLRVNIESVVFDSGGYGDMIRVESESLGTYEMDGEERGIRASDLFSIYYNEDDEICYRPKSKLAKFLKRHKLNSVGEIIGMEVITTIKATDKGDFIGFA